MSKNNSEDQKNKLLNAIDSASAESKKVTEQGQDIVKTANLQRQVAKAAKQIINAIPDDSYLKKEEWELKTRQWYDTAEVFKQFGDSIDANVIVSVTASNATGTSGYVLPAIFNGELPRDKQSIIDSATLKLNTIIRNSSWDQGIEDNFKRLGLTIDKQSQKSPLSLFQAAHSALSIPSKDILDASAVLIPAREAINRCLADLLPKRPKQEPAGRAADKVSSIAKQLKYDHFTDETINDLSCEVGTLIDQLSSAKQGNLSELQIHALFNKTKSFLMAFLSMIDDKKMK